MRGAITSVLLTIAIADVSLAQTVAGTIWDERGRPVSEAEVLLRDSTETVAAIIRTKANGKYSAKLSRPGSYHLHVRRLGYVPPAPQSVSVALDSTVVVDISIKRAAIQLSPLTVRAQRDSIRMKKVFGMDLRTISGYIITPAEFEMRSIGAQSVIDVVRSSTTWVRRVSTTGNTECIGTSREGGRFTDGPPCLLVYLNGLRIDPLTVGEAVSLNAVDYVVLLRPIDAMTIFGAGAHNGVMIIYTKNSTQSGAPKPE